MTAARSKLLDDARRAGLGIWQSPRNPATVVIARSGRPSLDVDGVLILPDGSAIALPIDSRGKNPRSFRDVRASLGLGS